MYPSYVPSGFLFLVEMTQVHVTAKIADLIVVGVELFKVVLTRFYLPQQKEKENSRHFPANRFCTFTRES